MQDIFSLGTVSERFFGRGDRRLRPHHQNLSVKCPRCDSLNTKFCYYNNYNLSQPRHFCKTCRRYWTNGGVLRNVPVGGGCRNTKCSEQKKSSKIKTPRERKANSYTSSENSSLTEFTTLTGNITDEASGTKISSDSSLFNFSDSRLCVPESVNTNIEQNSSAGTIFSEIGTFTSLITATTDEIMAGILDQTVHVDLPRSNNGEGFTPLDGDYEKLFEFTGTVDQSYWTQNQWSDYDHSLCLLD